MSSFLEKKRNLKIIRKKDRRFFWPDLVESKSKNKIKKATGDPE